MTSKTWFFAYGPLSDPDVFSAVTGRKRTAGKAATLYGYDLHLQKFRDIPGPARSWVSKFWEKDFKMYVLVKGSGKVRGVIWSVNDEDMPGIKIWELVDEGWYTLMKGNARLDDGRSVSAITIAIKGQKTIGKIDGMHYDPFFGRKRTLKPQFIKNIRMALKLYVEWQKVNAPPSKASGKA
jgi:hypothetical protein